MYNVVIMCRYYTNVLRYEIANSSTFQFINPSWNEVTKENHESAAFCAIKPIT